jgi:hypothetical protein
MNVLYPEKVLELDGRSLKEDNLNRFEILYQEKEQKSARENEKAGTNDSLSCGGQQMDESYRCHDLAEERDWTFVHWAKGSGGSVCQEGLDMFD